MSSLFNVSLLVLSFVFVMLELLLTLAYNAFYYPMYIGAAALTGISLMKIEEYATKKKHHGAEYLAKHMEEAYWVVFVSFACLVAASFTNPDLRAPLDNGFFISAFGILGGAGLARRVMNVIGETFRKDTATWKDTHPPDDGIFQLEKRISAFVAALVGVGAAAFLLFLALGAMGIYFDPFYTHAAVSVVIGLVTAYLFYVDKAERLEVGEGYIALYDVLHGEYSKVIYMRGLKPVRLRGISGRGCLMELVDASGAHYAIRIHDQQGFKLACERYQIQTKNI